MKKRLVTRKAKWGATIAAVGLTGVLGAGVAFAATPSSPSGPPNTTSPAAGRAAMTPAQAKTMMSDMANALPVQDRGRFQAMETGMIQMMNDAHMFDRRAGTAKGSMMGGSNASPMTGSGSMMGGGPGR